MTKQNYDLEEQTVIFSKLVIKPWSFKYKHQKTSQREVFGESNLTRYPGLSTCPQHSKACTPVKFTQNINHKAVEVGGIELPDPWLTNLGPRQATPTANSSYHTPLPPYANTAGKRGRGVCQRPGL